MYTHTHTHAHTHTKQIKTKQVRKMSKKIYISAASVAILAALAPDGAFARVGPFKPHYTLDKLVQSRQATIYEENNYNNNNDDEYQLQAGGWVGPVISAVGALANTVLDWWLKGHPVRRHDDDEEQDMIRREIAMAKIPLVSQRAFNNGFRQGLLQVLDEVEYNSQAQYWSMVSKELLFQYPPTIGDDYKLIGTKLGSMAANVTPLPRGVIHIKPILATIPQDDGNGDNEEQNLVVTGVNVALSLINTVVQWVAKGKFDDDSDESGLKEQINYGLTKIKPAHQYEFLSGFKTGLLQTMDEDEYFQNEQMWANVGKIIMVKTDIGSLKCGMGSIGQQLGTLSAQEVLFKKSPALIRPLPPIGSDRMIIQSEYDNNDDGNEYQLQAGGWVGPVISAVGSLANTVLDWWLKGHPVRRHEEEEEEENEQQIAPIILAVLEWAEIVNGVVTVFQLVNGVVKVVRRYRKTGRFDEDGDNDDGNNTEIISEELLMDELLEVSRLDEVKRKALHRGFRTGLRKHLDDIDIDVKLWSGIVNKFIAKRGADELNKMTPETLYDLALWVADAQMQPQKAELIQQRAIQDGIGAIKANHKKENLRGIWGGKKPSFVNQEEFY